MGSALWHRELHAVSGCWHLACMKAAILQAWWTRRWCFQHRQCKEMGSRQSLDRGNTTCTDAYLERIRSTCGLGQCGRACWCSLACYTWICCEGRMGRSCFRALCRSVELWICCPREQGGTKDTLAERSRMVNSHSDTSNIFQMLALPRDSDNQLGDSNKVAIDGWRCEQGARNGGNKAWARHAFRTWERLGTGSQDACSAEVWRCKLDKKVDGTVHRLSEVCLVAMCTWESCCRCESGFCWAPAP